MQLHKVKLGLEPSDWKLMPTIGPSVREIRVRDDSSAFRALYVGKAEEAVFVPHAFQKKTQQAVKRDLDLAAARLRQI